ncbi:peptidoglycan-binding protein [Ornithinimicrobium pekingense]|uniref:Peptidoglycan binding-like domain-containing protein n=1 Tax=Ornithinimicrobium pekingense TaxID=384677 RepID=A0ABQ2F5Z0_9MICO|nr:peptidoglycan-binding protein [Ornithinimicrobium pekingense]GGK56360.1 hypothetical protein GCM10011509_00930 [Ornithinimicrobium pekingense]
MLAGVIAAGGALPALADDPPVEGDQGAGPAPAAPAVPGPRTGFTPNGGFGGSASFVPVPADPDVVPEPPTREGLPEQVDEKGPFAQQISCDPATRPGVTAFALLVSSHYDRPSFSGARPCIDYASFHHDGRALDWPLNAWDSADRQIADAVISWLVADDGEVAKRFGIEYLIWNGLIWDNNSGRWSYYTGNPHTDHIHFSFTWDGAQMRTSWWTGVAVTEPDLGPCDVTPRQYAALHQAPRTSACDAATVAAVPSTGLARVRPGESGSGVAMLQEVLELEPTGVLDEATRRALVEWQEEHDIPATGVADEFSYAVATGQELAPLPPDALAVPRQEWQTTAFTPHLRTTLTQGDEGEAVTVLQEALGVEADGSFGPLTAKALTEWEQTVPVLKVQASRRGDAPATVTPLTWVLLERAAHPTLVIRDVELEHGDLDEQADPDGELAKRATVEGRSDSPYMGGAVTLLQQLLGVDDDGSFGPGTEAAVIEVQKAAELEPTGVVDGPTWAAVEAQALEAGRVDGAPGATATAEKKAAEKKAAEKKAAEKKAAEKKAAEKKAAEKKAAEKKKAEREAQERARAWETAVQGAS